MLEFSLWKQLKKRLRRGRRPVWTLGCLLAAIAVAVPVGTGMAQAEGVSDVRSDSHAISAMPGDKIGVFKPAPDMEDIEASANTGVIDTLAEAKGPVKVTLRRIYLCGNEKTPLGRMEAKEALRLLQRHPEWTAVLDRTGTVVMEQRIDDLSAACKKSAYMSVDKEGNLSLFDGPPEKEKVLRTFFQLDVRYMESRLPKERLEELVSGIKVNDLDDYNSVLSSFSDYAVNKSERVMKPTY